MDLDARFKIRQFKTFGQEESSHHNRSQHQVVMVEMAAPDLPVQLVPPDQLVLPDQQGRMAYLDLQQARGQLV
jgi:hypothetical protein